MGYQMLPYKRCAEMIYDLAGQKISEGALANFQAKAYNRLVDFEQQIKSLLLMEYVLHADETGVKVNGKSNRMHVTSTHLLSFFGFHSKRGKQASDRFNILPLYNGTIMHDRFSSYFSYGKTHALCNAHILRELEYIWETKQKKWVKTSLIY
ncbi:MAG TPA: transposase [Flavobacteriaceae bacterium]|nr:transposase [Flavobacteriaceae bacterium]